jgi:hypothetical protein
MDQDRQQELPFASRTPHVLDPEQARENLALGLGRLLRLPVTLRITDNRQRMFTARRAGQTWQVRLHHMFLDADETVIEALASYIGSADRMSSRLIDRFIEQSAHKIRRMPSRRTQPVIQCLGRVHDLQEIFDELNRAGLPGRVDCSVTWGRDNRGRRRRSLRLGSYDPGHRLIRIHPVLDQEWVPRYFVSSVVHHEMCHAVMHDTKGAEASIRHDRAFRSLERGFSHRDRVRSWQAKNLTRLLRY